MQRMPMIRLIAIPLDALAIEGRLIGDLTANIHEGENEAKATATASDVLRRPFHMPIEERHIRGVTRNHAVDIEGLVEVHIGEVCADDQEARNVLENQVILIGARKMNVLDVPIADAVSAPKEA